MDVKGETITMACDVLICISKTMKLYRQNMCQTLKVLPKCILVSTLRSVKIDIERVKLA